MKKYFSTIPILALFFLFTVIPARVFAATVPTPSAAPTEKITPSLTPEPTVSETDIRESLQDRLKKAAEEKSKEASQVLGTSEKRAIVGILKDLTNNTLTIQPKIGGTKLAAITDKTVFVRKGKTVKQSDLVIGDFTIAMGYINTTNVLEAHRVVAVEKPDDQPERKVFIGTVSEVDLKRNSLTVTHDRAVELGGPEMLTVTVSKKSDLDLSKLETHSKLIIVGISDDKTSSLILKAYKIL